MITYDHQNRTGPERLGWHYNCEGSSQARHKGRRDTSFLVLQKLGKLDYSFKVIAIQVFRIGGPCRLEPDLQAPPGLYDQSDTDDHCPELIPS
ncbi:hypothetical protein EVAR_79089_1 [Eumeta japonica]|uniref:Uncharacterized protein n=1 Tax=Eumeta variegata TaxID=151549 RepID=A0A4C1X1B8_EUMVA|nr:hypothetical protein EVAR_79089_1 [Eumeta japonica]